MRIGAIVLKIRTADTTFGNRIAGSADLALAQKHTFNKDTAFVIQLSDSPTPNKLDNGLFQTITERFAVIVAIQNDSTNKDKTGFIAYDSLYNIRKELFKAILGWQIPDTDYVVSYGGSKIIGINRAFLWYQFEFESMTNITEADGIEEDKTLLEDFNSIYAQWIITPDANVPIVGPGGLQVSTDITDMESKIDFTDNPNDGGFSNGFNSKYFQTYKG